MTISEMLDLICTEMDMRWYATSDAIYLLKDKRVEEIIKEMADEMINGKSTTTPVGLIGGGE